MATLIDLNKVKYTCSCGRKKSLAYLYFCKHCVTLKCKECVLHEIDPKYFCTHCFDNKTSKEASMLKYKCSNCYNCPICQHKLTTRAASINVQKKLDNQQSPDPQQQQQQQPQAQKVFYLVCGCCRWSTRDANVPDATTTPGGWKLQENPNSKRIIELLDYYKSISLKEKHEKEKKKYPYGTKRKIFQSPVANDMLGILTPFQKLLQTQTNDIEIKLTESTKTATFDILSDDVYSTKLNLNSITTIDQRLSNPEFQVDKSNRLYPLNTFFVTKESKRCNTCDHNVIKPENNITSIKFKLHQMAIFMIPEIRVVTIPEWKLNEKNEVILSITNKCECEVNVTLVSSIKEDKSEADIIFNDESIVVDRQDAKSATSLLKQTDNQNYICYRKDNKIAVVCHVKPKDENSNIECTFIMKHSYYGMSADLQSAPVMQILSQYVTIDFGSFKSPNVIQRPKYIYECLSNTIKNTTK